MRIQKAFFVAGILFVIGLFITEVANAADMNQWIGKWFSYTVRIKGIEIESDGSGISKGSSKESGFLKITGCDGDSCQIDSYWLDSGVWQSDTQTIKIIAGNYLNFLFVIRNETDESGETFIIAALMQGSEKNGMISSAIITTYGGIMIDTDNEDNDVGAGNVTLTAKMVAESKVPSAVLGGSGGGSGTGAGNFTVPRAAITIDGNIDDWASIVPAYVDKANDEDPGANFVGTDLKGVYLARDDEFLYIMFTLYDGNPSAAQYTFEPVPTAGSIGVSGDYLAVAIFKDGAWRTWMGVRENSQLNIQYPANYVAVGNGCIEWKVKIEDFHLFNDRYLMAYIHNYIPVFYPVSDSAKTGIKLHLN
jgi:hypothetical protein